MKEIYNEDFELEVKATPDKVDIKSEGDDVDELEEFARCILGDNFSYFDADFDEEDEEDDEEEDEEVEAEDEAADLVDDEEEAAEDLVDEEEPIEEGFGSNLVNSAKRVVQNIKDTDKEFKELSHPDAGRFVIQTKYDDFYCPDGVMRSSLARAQKFKTRADAEKIANNGEFVSEISDYGYEQLKRSLKEGIESINPYETTLNELDNDKDGFIGCLFVNNDGSCDVIGFDDLGYEFDNRFSNENEPITVDGILTVNGVRYAVSHLADGLECDPSYGSVNEFITDCCSDPEDWSDIWDETKSDLNELFNATVDLDVHDFCGSGNNARVLSGGGLKEKCDDKKDLDELFDAKLNIDAHNFTGDNNDANVLSPGGMISECGIQETKSEGEDLTDEELATKLEEAKKCQEEVEEDSIVDGNEYVVKSEGEGDEQLPTDDEQLELKEKCPECEDFESMSKEDLIALVKELKK